MTDRGGSSGPPHTGYSPILGPYRFPPLSATVQVDVGAHSRPGKSREINEDHYLIMRLARSQETIKTSLTDDAVVNGFEEHGYGLVVADGVSATGRGEQASRVALLTLAHLVSAFGKWSLRIDERTAEEIRQRAERFYRHVDGALVRETPPDEPPRLQTTLTAAFSAGRDLFFVHVGHSRAYLFRDGRLTRLTRDHSVGAAESGPRPASSLVDVSEATRDLHHILTNTLGMSGTVGPRIDIERFQLDDKDMVLVCTNGLTDAVDDDRIAQELASDRSPDDTCRALVDLAATLDGTDDTTALLAHYRIPT